MKSTVEVKYFGKSVRTHFPLSGETLATIYRLNKKAPFKDLAMSALSPISNYVQLNTKQKWGAKLTLVDMSRYNFSHGYMECIIQTENIYFWIKFPTCHKFSRFALYVLGFWVFTFTQNNKLFSAVWSEFPLNFIQKLNEFPLIYFSICTQQIHRSWRKWLSSTRQYFFLLLLLYCIRNEINFDVFTFQAGTAMECLSVRLIKSTGNDEPIQFSSFCSRSR